MDDDQMNYLENHMDEIQHIEDISAYEGTLSYFYNCNF